MRRIVRGAALVVLLTAGCGVEQVHGQQSAVGLTAAVLSQQDLPPDFLPAEDQQVFGRVEPADPDCRRLLALADLRGLRDVPQVHSVFYRTDPGSTLAERVAGLTPERVDATVQDARDAVAGCPSIRVKMHDNAMRLQRSSLQAGKLGTGALGVRYSQHAGRYDLAYDIIMVPVTDRLLVVSQPELIDRHRPTRSDSTLAMARAALDKLQNPAPSPTPSP